MEVISNGRENNLFGSLISFLSFSKFHASILITQRGVFLPTIGQKNGKKFYIRLKRHKKVLPKNIFHFHFFVKSEFTNFLHFFWGFLESCVHFSVTKTKNEEAYNRSMTSWTQKGNYSKHRVFNMKMMDFKELGLFFQQKINLYCKALF